MVLHGFYMASSLGDIICNLGIQSGLYCQKLIAKFYGTAPRFSFTCGLQACLERRSDRRALVPSSSFNLKVFMYVTKNFCEFASFSTFKLDVCLYDVFV